MVESGKNDVAVEGGKPGEPPESIDVMPLRVPVDLAWFCERHF